MVIGESEKRREQMAQNILADTAIAQGRGRGPGRYLTEVEGE
jgi:hypothetical protein